jgi:hypothetical protein
MEIRYIAVGVLLFTILSARGSMGVGGEDDLGRFAAAQRLTTSQLVDALSSPNQGDRAAAAEKFRFTRSIISDHLGTRLRRMVENGSLDNSYQSETHLVLQLIAQWRVRESVNELAEIVVFELNPATFPAGAKYGPAAYYPAAWALAEIGGQTVVESMFEKIQNIDKENEIRVCTWVLYKALGEDLAITALKQRAEAMSVREIKGRLLKAASLVAKGESLLPFKSPLHP